MCIRDSHIEDSISDFEKQKSVELAKQIPMVQLGRAWQMLLKGIAEVQSSSSTFSALEMLAIRVVYLAEKREDTSTRMSTEEDQKKKAELSGEEEKPSSAAATSQRVERTIENDGEIENLPTTFVQIVDIFEKKREAIIHANLIEKVKPVKVEAGLMEIEATDDLDKDLTGPIGKLLTEWTGIPWQISLVHSPGEKTLREKMADEECEAKEKAKNDPIVSSVLSSFPGTKVQSVRKIMRRTDSKN